MEISHFRNGRQQWFTPPFFQGMETHYTTLGVNQNASPEDLAQAKRRLAAIWHPDKEEGDEDVMKAINHAYDVLCDPDSRREYDEVIAKRVRRSLSSLADRNRNQRIFLYSEPLVPERPAC